MNSSPERAVHGRTPPLGDLARASSNRYVGPGTRSERPRQRIVRMTALCRIGPG